MARTRGGSPLESRSVSFLGLIPGATAGARVHSRESCPQDPSRSDASVARFAVVLASNGGNP